MRKKIFALALATVMAGSLAACGGSAEETTAAATTAAAETEAADGTEAAEEGAAAETAATDWEPTGTVSIVVPAGAGGDTDLTARIFAQYAKELTGHDFIVVNSNGAAGSVAANQVLGSAADGMTVLYGHNLVNVANIAGVTDYNYTAFKLGPTFAKNPAQQLYVNPEKYADLDAFIEAAKANPGKLMACTEVGAYTYYELLAFEKEAGIDLDLVDVGSNSDKIAAMLSGQVDLMPGAYMSCKDYLAAGQFVALGAPTEERYDIIKDIPTFKEQGIDLVYPDCDYSFYFPKETPDEVITYFDNLVQQMMDDPDVQQALTDLDVMPYYLSPADSEANDEAIYNTIKEIAASVEG